MKVNKFDKTNRESGVYKEWYEVSCTRSEMETIYFALRHYAEKGKLKYETINEIVKLTNAIREANERHREATNGQST